MGGGTKGGPVGGELGRCFIFSRLGRRSTNTSADCLFGLIRKAAPKLAPYQRHAAESSVWEMKIKTLLCMWWL